MNTYLDGLLVYDKDRQRQVPPLTSPDAVALTEGMLTQSCQNFLIPNNVHPYFKKKKVADDNLLIRNRKVPRRTGSTIAPSQHMAHSGTARYDDSIARDLQRGIEMLTITTAAGDIVVRFERRYKNANTFRSSTRNATNHFNWKESFSAKIILTPCEDVPRRCKVILMCQQAKSLSDTRVSIPFISFRRMIPDDHDIFYFIQDGDLDSVIAAVRSGQVYVTDQDTSGRSLLNVSQFIRSVAS